MTDNGGDRTSSRGWQSALDRGRRWLLPVALVAGMIAFGQAQDPKLLIRDWYFWRYLGYWAVAATWVVACSSCGFAVLRRVLRSPLPLLEHLTLCFAVGLLCFFFAMFVGGLLGLYGSAFFVGILLVLLAPGALPGYRYVCRLRRHLRAARGHARPAMAPGVLLLWGLGLIAGFLFYLPGIVPAQIGYDSAWYHVPLGEHYARLGRIERLPEGWFPGTVPHLSSLVYCFAFLLPGGKLFDYVELASHLEFAATAMALLGIPALVRRLVPRTRAHVSWVAFFTFPGIYWYDALIGGDQFALVWTVPIALTLLRTFPELSWRHGFLLACAYAGEVLTKYSASGILIGPALGIGLRVLWVAAQSVWQRAAARILWQRVRGGLFTAAMILLLTTPLWAKNWLWHGDPFFPLLHRYFRSTPWSADASVFFADYQLEMAGFQPPPGWPGIKESLEAVFTHALRPADYSSGPFRGALFTLMCGCLPFVRAPWRLWGVAAMCNIAVFGWYLQMHQDRYLMAFMPGMAAVLVAVAVLAWRSSLVARALLVAMFVLHTAFGLGVFALGNPNGHYRRVLDFAVAVANGSKEPGMGELARWDAVGKTMPAKSKALIHGMHGHAGLGHPSVSDWPRLQMGISYGRMSSAAAMYRELKGMGVTHLVWGPDNWADDSYAGDLRFYEFVQKYADPKHVQGLYVGTMPSSAPPATHKPQFIAFIGCDGRYAAGLYPFSAMTVPNPRRLSQPPYPSPLEIINDNNSNDALARADYAIFRGDCGLAEPSNLGRDFRVVGRREGYSLYARRD